MVDDEVKVMKSVQRALQEEHDVTCVQAAADALALLSQGERFEVILCDLMMPQMTGMELHEKLAAQFPDQAKRTVFMTGGAFTERARAFAARRQHRVLTKPVDVRELELLLAELMGVQPGRREPNGRS